MSDDVEDAIGPDRRAFIKRLVITGAFAVPVVSSFTMSGVQGVFGASAGAQVENPNTTDPDDDDDDDDEGENEGENGKDDDGTNSSSGQDPANANAAGAVVASPKFAG